MPDRFNLAGRYRQSFFVFYDVEQNFHFPRDFLWRRSKSTSSSPDAVCDAVHNYDFALYLDVTSFDSVVSLLDRVEGRYIDV